MNNYKSYGKLVKVKESTFLKLKEIRDSENKKSIDSVIMKLIENYEKSHSLEVQARNTITIIDGTNGADLILMLARGAKKSCLPTGECGT